MKKLSAFFSFNQLKLPNSFKGLYVLGWALFLFYVAIAMPLYNPDITGYVASVYGLMGLSGDALKEATFNDLRSALPSNTFSELIRCCWYKMYGDASVLQQQIPFFNIRYVYVWSIYALGQLTGSFLQAIVLISATCGFFIILISGILFWKVKSTIAFLFVPPAVIFGGALELSRITTADALATLVAISLCALILARKHMAVAFLIVLLPLFRTDYLIFSLVAGLILFLRGNSRVAMLSVSFALLTYFAVNHFAENYGHAVIFNYSFIDRWNPYPSSMPISDNVFDYVWAYMRGIWNLANKSHIFFYPLIYTIALIFLLPNRYQNRFLIIYFACLFFVVVHFLLFPAALFRHYFILLWASIMYLSEVFALHLHPVRKTPKAPD